MPAQASGVVEPFVGGGAVFLSMPQLPAAINDRSVDLIQVYREVAAGGEAWVGHLRRLDEAWLWIEQLADREAAQIAAQYRESSRWDALVRGLVMTQLGGWSTCAGAISDAPGAADGLAAEAARALTAKLARMSQLEAQRGRLSDEDVVGNVEGAMKAAMYLTVRAAYNAEVVANRGPSARRAAWFYFLRELCYASMFRFNRSGAFNVPYGGMSYNRKRITRKVDDASWARLVQAFRQAVICNLDFERFLCEHPPAPADFVFFDPPYDSDFSTYDQATFGAADHRRLRAVVGALEGHGQVMLVVKNSPLMMELYGEDRFRVRHFDKTYMWTIKERNDRSAQHVLITNY